MTVRTIDDIFRDFVIDGVPASGPFNPHKPDIRDTLKALLEGISTFPDNRVIRLNNADEGTGNNIVVTASVPIPAAAYQVLYILNVTQENTGPVAISGVITRDLVTNTSQLVPAGYLTPGMAVLCIDTGSELRMLSYGDMETIIAAAEAALAAAEAARDAAEQARDEAQSAASDAVSQGNVPIYSTRNAVEGLEIPAGINAIRTNGFTTIGDGGDALYKRVSSEPSHAGKVQSDDGAWWEVARQSVTPLQFGADATGVTDSTPAFSAAAKYVPAFNNEAQRVLFPNAPVGTIFVPAGEYLLSSIVDTGGKNIYWSLDQAAKITNIHNLSGTVYRDGQRASSRHYGTKDNACTASFSANGPLDSSAQVLGLTDATMVGTYTDRDSVTVFAENTAPPVSINITSATYTATTITPSPALNDGQLKLLRVGMIIDTKHATKYSGVITGWSSDGASITVAGWYLAGSTTPSTPASAGAYVNPITKIWAHNANVILNSGSFANKMCGFELGLINKQDSASNFGADHTWGFDVVNLGTFKCSVGFIQRGSFDVGFLSRGANSAFVGMNNSNQQYFGVASTGIIDLGNASDPNAIAVIDFHSGGLDTDYDCRLRSYGAAATNASMRLTAHNYSPSVDNGTLLGTASFRWGQIYSSVSTIATSDEREKEWIGELSGAELRVAKALSKLIGFYKWKDAIALKGDEARIHAGVKAQAVKAAFEDEGLNGFSYGVLCYDEWDETPEQKTEEGKVITPYSAAGNRYGVRYDELWSFVTAGFEARLSALEND